MESCSTRSEYSKDWLPVIIINHNSSRYSLSYDYCELVHASSKDLTFESSIQGFVVSQEVTRTRDFDKYLVMDQEFQLVKAFMEQFEYHKKAA